MTLGEKIKALRLERKMTQKELAGDKITRNMLSQIESGKATPSIETLNYLADTLAYPISYFFTENSNLFLYEKGAAIKEIYLAYKNNAYKYCINLINRLKEKDDEINFLLSSCHFELGKTALFKGNFITAEENLKKSLEYSEKTVLKTEYFTALIPMYLAITKNIHAPLLEFDQAEYQSKLYKNFDYEFFKYLTLDFDYKYKNEAYAKHALAKEKIKERDYKTAIKLLKELAEESIDRAYNAFLIFTVYSDLENCYKQLYDFENAYRYSTKRLSLLEGFKS